MTTMASIDAHGHAWVPRLLDLPALLAERSHFLLRPRQTGKTYLIRNTLKDARVYDLLDTSVYLGASAPAGSPRRLPLAIASW